MTDSYIVGIDVGGTFTDVICLNTGTGTMQTAKVSSHPGEQWKGVLSSLGRLEIAPDQIEVFAHGTTIATNALLERKGAKTVLLTTAGFRDTIEIGKTRRLVGGLFDTRFERPKPLVPRKNRLEIEGRIDGRGAVSVPLSDLDLEAAIAFIRDNGIESVAIGFLNSYLNDAHEKRAYEVLRAALPETVQIFTSTGITREKGEYERFSTVVLNAYLAPNIGFYLDRLEGQLAQASVNAPVSVMSSNGGFMTLSRARRFPVRTFLSGPVGGVIGALRLAAASGVEQFITFDMGGTSTDVALCAGAMPKVSYSNLIEAFPSQAAQLDIHTIGAGGGSIAHRSEDGGLYVGPTSAGANPGPAAYQRGGTQPTVTDANVVLGRLPVRNTLGGNVQLSREAAMRAFAALTDAGSDDEVFTLADGVLKIAVLKMAGAVQEVSVHRGHDPRDFTLVGFGGAGPMHVFLVAEEMGIRSVLIPRHPGHISAYGQILADTVLHLVHPFPAEGVDDAALQAAIAGLEAEAAAQFVEDGLAVAGMKITAQADARYKGQSFTIEVPVDTAAPSTALTATRFHALHEATFGHGVPGNPVEITALRVVASLPRALPPSVAMTHEAVTAGAEAVPVFWNGGWIDTPVLRRETLTAGTSVTGPLIIEEQGATTVVPPRWTVLSDAHGNLLCDFPAQMDQ